MILVRSLQRSEGDHMRPYKIYTYILNQYQQTSQSSHDPVSPYLHKLVSHL